MPVLYTSDHEWIATGDADAATVGITTHAQDARPRTAHQISIREMKPTINGI